MQAVSVSTGVDTTIEPPTKRARLTYSDDKVSKKGQEEIQNSTITEYLNLFFYTPRILIHDWNKVFGKDFFEEFPGLSECRCMQVHEKARAILESKTLEQMKLVFPPEKALTCVSVGCGECFQELIYMIKMFQAGYNTMHFVLIDSGREQDKIKQAVQSLENFYKKYLLPLPRQPQIEISFYPTQEAYYEAVQSKGAPKAHLLLGIDLQGEMQNGLALNRIAIEYFSKKKLLEKEALVVFTEDCNPLSEQLSYCSLHRFCQQQGLSFRAGHVYASTQSEKGNSRSYLYRGAVYSTLNQ